jgi:hypothetical protein
MNYNEGWVNFPVRTTWLRASTSFREKDEMLSSWEELSTLTYAQLITAGQMPGRDDGTFRCEERASGLIYLLVDLSIEPDDLLPLSDPADPGDDFLPTPTPSFWAVFSSTVPVIEMPFAP